MAYHAYVTALKNVRPHPNADRMKLADCFENTVCVGLNAAEGDLGVYFPVDGQLSEEFCKVNDLVRRKDANGNDAGGYLDPNKRNIRAIRLRGEKSDGLFMPFSAFAYTGADLSKLTVGAEINELKGHPICQKYIPPVKPTATSHVAGAKPSRRKKDLAPLFYEHKDTEQLAYNLSAFHPGDEIEITLKMHGTSQRTGHLPTLQKYKRNFWDWLLRREGTPIYDWDFVTGTRRTVLDTWDAGFYGSDVFRRYHAKTFERKLWKGETVYYEVVGYTDSGMPIMAECPNNKVNDKAFAKMYGPVTKFSYGCAPDGWTCESHEKGFGPKQSDCYVYRMTMTNEDGEVVEYSPDFIRYRCEYMGAKTVPVLWRGFIPTQEELEAMPEYAGIENAAGEWVKHLAEQYYDGPDPIGKTHVREGVVIRILNRPIFTAYKHKNFSFKVLEGIVKDTAEAPDMEEAEEAYKEEETNEA